MSWKKNMFSSQYFAINSRIIRKFRVHTFFWGWNKKRKYVPSENKQPLKKWMHIKTFTKVQNTKLMPGRKRLVFQWWKKLKNFVIKQLRLLDTIKLFVDLCWIWNDKFTAELLIFIAFRNNFKRLEFQVAQWTEVRFVSFLSSGFTTMAVINPPDCMQSKVEKM